MNPAQPIHPDSPTRTLAGAVIDTRSRYRPSLEQILFYAAIELIVAGTVLWSLAVLAMVL